MAKLFAHPYVLSGLALAVATVLRAALTPLWGSDYSLISYFPAIMFSLWVGGWRAGVAATGLSALLSLWLFMPSGAAGASHAAALGLFLIANAGMILAAESWRRARVRAEALAAIDAARAEQQRRHVAERRRTEEALRQSEERLRLFIDHAPAAIAMFDRDMRYLAVSARWRKDYRLTGELVGRLHYDLFPEISDRWKAVHRRGLAGEVVHADEEPFVRSDGRVQWLKWEVRPWRRPDGEVGGILVTTEDVSEGVLARQALHDQLNLVKTITDNATSALFMMDPYGRATFANPAAEQMTGYRLDELQERVLHHVIHHTRPDGTPFPIEECPIDRALPLQESIHGYEDVFVHKDGRFYPVRCAARPIVKDGASIGTVVEVQDITRERRAADDLQLLAADLERRVRERTSDLVRSQDRLRALASQLAMAEQRARHRLATELHDYLAQLLALGRIKLGHARRLLGRAPAGAGPLADLEDILDRALGYTRTVMAELSPPVLHDLGLAVGLEWLGQQMGRHGLHVTVEHEPAAAAAAARTTEDLRVMLFQSARELLLNVVKHAGVERARVTLAVEAGDRLVLTVRDEGEGFDPGGLGRGGGPEHFGLFSLHERMEAVGGRMEIDSRPGAGTSVRLALPLGSRSEPGSKFEVRGSTLSGDGGKTVSVNREPRTSNGSISLPAGPEGHQPHTTVRVLLVDDHVVVRQGLRSLLDGYTDVIVVGEAGNGEEAVALARELRPDVVLMDINMPRMDGLEATVRIMQERPDTLVIGLSVNSAAHIRDAMRAAGAAGFMTKESAADQLYEAVIEAVGSKG